MITGAHVIVFGTGPDEVRDFFRDVLELPWVDAGGGWPIFGLPPAEVAAHPSERDGVHELYLMCDDVEATIAELEAKGVEFTEGITEERWGRVTRMRLPGGGELALYQPLHPSPPPT
jgi:catechol 2,3-dioxygenase-like lactoylglutathione lyase family enzyme